METPYPSPSLRNLGNRMKMRKSFVSLLTCYLSLCDVFHLCQWILNFEVGWNTKESFIQCTVLKSNKMFSYQMLGKTSSVPWWLTAQTQELDFSGFRQTVLLVTGSCAI